MFRIVLVLAVGTPVFGCFVEFACPQDPPELRAAKRYSATGSGLQSADLQFTDDGRLLVMRHFGGNTPLFTIHAIEKGRSLVSPLVAANMFSKEDLRDNGYYDGASAQLNRGGNIILTTSAKTVRLWEISKYLKPVGTPLISAGGIRARFSNDGMRFVTVTAIGVDLKSGRIQYEAQIRDALSGKLSGESGKAIVSVGGRFGGPFAGPVMKALLWSPDDKVFITACSGEVGDAKSVHFWDAVKMQPVGESILAEGDFHQFTRDGKALWVISKKGITLWDVTTRKAVCSLLTPEIGKSFVGADTQSVIYGMRRWFAVHPNERSVFYVSGNKAELLDFSGDQPKKKLVLHHSSETVDGAWISPDGKLAATREGRNEVRVWNLDTGKPFLIIPVNAPDVKAVEFSPEGRFLATVDETGVRIWLID